MIKVDKTGGYLHAFEYRKIKKVCDLNNLINFTCENENFLIRNSALFVSLQLYTFIILFERTVSVTSAIYIIET